MTVLILVTHTFDIDVAIGIYARALPKLNYDFTGYISCDLLY